MKESSGKRGIYCRKGRQRAHCQESPLHRNFLRDKKNSVHIDSQRTQTIPTAAQASQIAKKKFFYFKFIQKKFLQCHSIIMKKSKSVIV